MRAQGQRWQHQFYRFIYLSVFQDFFLGWCGFASIHAITWMVMMMMTTTKTHLARDPKHFVILCPTQPCRHPEASKFVFHHVWCHPKKSSKYRSGVVACYYCGCGTLLEVSLPEPESPPSVTTMRDTVDRTVVVPFHDFVPP